MIKYGMQDKVYIEDTACCVFIYVSILPLKHADVRGTDDPQGLMTPKFNLYITVKCSIAFTNPPKPNDFWEGSSREKSKLG